MNNLSVLQYLFGYFVDFISADQKGKHLESRSRKKKRSLLDLGKCKMIAMSEQMR